jgi:replicative DNA helicase
MPRLNDITGKGPDTLDIGAPSLGWLKEAIGPGFIRGGIYLLAGEPGIGKTTLAIQVLGDLAIRDRQTFPHDPGSITLLAGRPVDGQQPCQIGQVHVPVAVEVAVFVRGATGSSVVSQ